MLIAGPALAGGPSGSGSVSLDLGIGGNAGIEGKIEGGTYALGKNGSDAFAQSSNIVKGWGLSQVHIGESFNVGSMESWGKSVAKTSGPKAQAEAFETRKLSLDNFTRFNADLGYSQQTQFSGFGDF